MVERAGPADLTDQHEDWREDNTQATMTANTTTLVISRKADANEEYILTHVGTNGGYDVVLQVKNKNDQFGEDIPGLFAPLMPPSDWYEIRPWLKFKSGDEFRLYAISGSNRTTETKFMAKGFKRDISGA